MLLTRRAPTVSMVDTRSAPKTTSSSSSSSTSRPTTSTSSSSSKTTSQQSQTNTSKSSASVSTASTSKSSTVSKTVASVAQTVIKDVVSISQAARRLAATSSVSNGTVSTLHKNQFLQADKGIGSGQHFEKMMDTGGRGTETFPVNNPAHNPPRISNKPGNEAIYVNQNSSKEVSANTNGSITLTNGSRTEVIEPVKSPHQKAVENEYNAFFQTSQEFKNAMNNPGNQLAQDYAVLKAKNAYEWARLNNDPAAMEAAHKASKYFQERGARITSDISLEQARSFYLAKEAESTKPTPKQGGVVDSFFNGFQQGKQNVEDGITRVITKPDEVAKDVAYTVTHPKEAFEAGKQYYVDKNNKYVNGTPAERAEMLGRDLPGLLLSGVTGTSIIKAGKGDGIKAAPVVATVANPLPNYENAVFVMEKLTKYALDPTNPKGANKAHVFQSVLGYDLSNANDLKNQVMQKLPHNEAIPTEADKFGQRYRVDMDITGPNGNTAIVRTGWIVAPESDQPRLTTIFVK